MIENRLENNASKSERVKDIVKTSLFAFILAAVNQIGGLDKEKKGGDDLRDAVISASLGDMRDSVSDREGITEKLQLEIIQKQKEIKELAYQEGKLIHFNGEAARELRNEKGDIFTFGNTEDGKKWMSLTTSNNVLTYLVSGGEGVPNTVLVDNDGGDSNIGKGSVLENVSDASKDIDESWVMLGTYSKLSNKKRFDISKEHGKYVIEALDMQTGKRASLVGPEADEIVQNVWKYYLDHLNSTI